MLRTHFILTSFICLSKESTGVCFNMILVLQFVIRDRFIDWTDEECFRRMNAFGVVPIHFALTMTLTHRN